MNILLADRSFQKLAPRVEWIVRNANQEKDAIVFDIDATVLYNTNEPWVGAEPNFKMQPVYALARERRIPVHFVTARIGTPENKVSTLRQLRAMGMDYFDSLFMRPPATPATAQDIAEYKLNARRTIARYGNKTIVLNVGDQWSDLLPVDSTLMKRLDSAFPQQHVMFTPDTAMDARYAVKLYETRH
jgi:hypothetical protein